MTGRERLLAVLHREMPDRVPCTPDISNMIPCRLTGKPFWDIYLYKDPPLWKAYIAAVKQLGIDGFLEGVPLDPRPPEGPPWREVIVARSDDRIITRKYRDLESGERQWSAQACVYDRDQPATHKPYDLLGLPEVPRRWEPVEGVREWPQGEALLRLVKREMGGQGLVGARCGQTLLVNSPEAIYEWHDHPEKFRRLRDERLAYYEGLFERILAMEEKPDFICLGGSGTLVWQTVNMFRELGLPILKRMSALCREAGIPSHVHACGPEAALVRMAAEETDLVSIDPLEPPPMGDCHLAEIKHRYGHRLVLKGNLHTTDVMLRGTRDDVLAASRRCIADAADGGGYILSTGDQCGRDTPLENFDAMIEACETWGRY